MAEKYGMDPDAFELTVRATCSPKDRNGAMTLTREEFAAFLLVAKEYGLNPLTKEIYAFPAKGGGIIPVVSVDGWLHLINGHPACDGFEFNVDRDEKGKLVAVTCRMFRKDRQHPVEITEWLDECKRETDPWRSMPSRMLRHKALIQAARYAFGFAGIYDEDEAERFAAVNSVQNAESARDVTPAPVNADPEKVTRVTSRPGPPPAAVIEHKPAVEMPKVEAPAKAAPVEAPPAMVQQAQALMAAGAEATKPAATKRPGPPPPPPPVQQKPAAQPDAVQQAVAAVQEQFPGATHVETRPAAPLVEKAPTFEQMRDKFEDAAKRATDEDALNEAWARIVEPWKDLPSDAEFAELSDKRATMGRAVAEWIGKSADAMPPERVRQRILDTWDGVCYLSGIRIDPAKGFDVEHVVSVRDGGLEANREGNLRPVLRDPHILKTAREKREQSKAERKKRAAAGTKAAPTKKIESAPFTPAKKKTPATGEIVKLAALPRRNLYA